MIELIKQNQPEHQDVIKEMKDMEPLEVCVVVDSDYRNHVVMRTANTDYVEIMDLSSLGAGECWVGQPTLKVRKLREGETYLLKLS